MTTNSSPATLPTDMALSFEQTVPRAVAHRRAVGEVFVTDTAELGADRFLLAWQVPRAHALWGDRVAAYHDPFSVAEAARQGCFVVVHRHLGIPIDLPFSLRRFSFQVLDLEPFRDDRRHPLQGVLDYRLANREFSGGELGSMTVDGVVHIGGGQAMTVSGDVVFVSRQDYQALRAYQRSRKPLAGAGPAPSAEPVAAAAVGRRDSRNVVVGAAGDPRAPRWPLVIDRSHPSYFDHDYDHVPGPFIVEGFRQTALLAATASGALSSPVAALTSLDTTFADFGEFEAPLHYQVGSAGAPPHGPGPDGPAHLVQAGLYQFGQEIARAAIGLTPYP